MDADLLPEQRALATSPLTQRVWLQGPAGCGKTTAGVARLAHMLEQGVPAHSILILVPQRTLGLAYAKAVRAPKALAGGLADILTLGGLARRMVELFWPLVAAKAGFAHPGRPPTFLTLETAQHYMARVVLPLIEQERYFETVTLQRNRIYSQVLDNLNKAAVVGFAHSEVGARLHEAWVGDEAQANVYDQVQECVNRFRAYCLENHLLDFSLQLEVFLKHLWPHPPCRTHLMARYQHLIADNVEEFTPAGCDLLAEWLPQCQSALAIYDEDGGYRSFLGADPHSAQGLKGLCPVQAAFTESLVASPGVQALERRLSEVLGKPSPAATARGDARRTLLFQYHRFQPQMVDGVVEEIRRLIQEEAVEPGQIVILAPFLSDALRFAIRHRLEAEKIPVQSHRPSRSLLEEPATRCLLTWASLAHPSWGFPPAAFDVAYALQQSIADLDLVRAQLLAETLYRLEEGGPVLLSFDQLKGAMQKRVTYLLGGRYEGLRIWLKDYRLRKSEPLDHCIRRLFGEVLSQLGYGFHGNFDAARVAANLIESIEKFRQVVEERPAEQGAPIGQEYFQLVRDGVIAAQYLESWKSQEQNAVLLAPAHTFLLANRPVDHQFWLNVSSVGWWERIFQPLTHPHVLSRRWEAGTPWTDKHEVEANQAALHRLVVGLLRRCRKRVYLGLSELDEQGLDQRGPLASALQRVLKSMAREEAHDV